MRQSLPLLRLEIRKSLLLGVLLQLEEAQLLITTLSIRQTVDQHGLHGPVVQRQQQLRKP
jgi:hypothetical protein